MSSRKAHKKALKAGPKGTPAYEKAYKTEYERLKNELKNKIAGVIFNETRGLRPNLSKESKKDPYKMRDVYNEKEKDWDQESKNELKEGRKNIGHVCANREAGGTEMGKGTASTKTPSEETLKDTLEKQAWDDSNEAAEEVIEALEKGDDPTDGSKHYFIRKGTETETVKVDVKDEEGKVIGQKDRTVYKNRPTWVKGTEDKGATPLTSSGPVRKPFAAGGDVEQGTDIYIDVYGGKY